ncbi:MAG: hypothetical protein LC808_35950 [Actinobacteria bacterium]|nr:hypothetical protein [Actinomycetota bacterium]
MPVIALLALREAGTSVRPPAERATVFGGPRDELTGLRSHGKAELTPWWLVVHKQKRALRFWGQVRLAASDVNSDQRRKSRATNHPASGSSGMRHQRSLPPSRPRGIQPTRPGPKELTAPAPGANRIYPHKQPGPPQSGSPGTTAGLRV